MVVYRILLTLKRPLNGQYFCTTLLCNKINDPLRRSILQQNNIAYIIVQQYSYSPRQLRPKHSKQRVRIYTVLYSQQQLLFLHILFSQSIERHKNEKRNKRTDSILRNTTHRQHNISRLRNIFQKVLMPSITLYNLSIVPTNIQYHCTTYNIVQKY